MTGLQAICMLMIRLWAAGVIISILSGYMYWFLSALIGDGEEGSTGPILDGAIWIAAAITALVLAPRLARLLAPPTARESVRFAFSIDDFVSAGSFLVGGFYLVELGPQFVASLGEILSTLAIREDDETPVISKIQWSRFLSAALTAAIALFLTFRPREIAKMFQSLQRAGLAKVDQAD